MHSESGIPLGPVSLAEIQEFRKVITGFQKNIYSSPNQNSLIFRGESHQKQNYLFLHEDHYSAISKLGPFFGARRQSSECKHFLTSLKAITDALENAISVTVEIVITKEVNTTALLATQFFEMLNVSKHIKSELIEKLNGQFVIRFLFVQNLRCMSIAYDSI